MTTKTQSLTPMIEHMLTTVDNPYDPFTQFEKWFEWDRQADYHTPAYLARVTFTSYELSEADQDLALELAIDEIVAENVLGIYRKVSRKVSPNQTQKEVI